MLFSLTRWPGILLFALAGLSALAFALVTVNLFAEAMASFGFIERHGAEALRAGAFVQLLELGFWGVVALLAYLVFKACEVELIFRYFHWSRGLKDRREMRFRRKERPDT